MVKTDHRLFPIGRLDRNSTGLIILTNDGDLALKLTHPRYHLPKVYEVTTEEPVSDEQLEKLSSGVSVYHEKTMPAETERLDYNFFKITIFQGLKRQIREMCKSIGLTVQTLNRTEIGPIKLGNLKTGSSRPLSKEEVTMLKSD